MIIRFNFVGKVHATGGFGFVRQAIRLDTQEFIALKYLNDADNAEARQRFAREVRQLETFKHQAIINLLAADVTGPAPCYAMPWMPQTLLDYCGKVTVADVQYLVPLFADVLAYLHAHGGFHRDFKPANVLVSPKGDCFLADFGLGNAPDCTRNFTNSVCGTPGYAAPELETLGASAASDMYSMGATLFHVITGVHPKESRSFDISRFIKLAPPPGVRDLILELTRSKPDDRPTALQVKTRFPLAPVPVPRKQTFVPAWVQAMKQQQPLPAPKPRSIPNVLKDLAAQNPYRQRMPPLPAPKLPVLPNPLKDLAAQNPYSFASLRPPLSPVRNLKDLEAPLLVGAPLLPPPLTDEQRRKRTLLATLATLGLVCLLTS